MRKNIFYSIGFRYAGLKSNSRFLSFLSRIAIFGMIFSVALLIVVMSVMNGFDKELRLRILDLVPHVSFYIDKNSGPSTFLEAEKKIRSHASVVRVEPFVEKEGLLKSASASEPLVVLGMNDYAALVPYASPVEWEQWQSNKNGIFISKYFSSKLSVGVGDQVIAIFPIVENGKTKMSFHGFQVSGVFDSKTELDKTFALVHLSFLQQTLNLNQPEGLRVTTNDLFQASKLAWALMAELPEGIQYRDWSQTHGALYDAVQMSRAMVNLLMFIIIAIAVFNVVSTLMLVVMERQQSIAILRVMGATKSNILKIFITQGCTIGITGAGIGALIGVVISLVLPSAVSWLEAIFGFHLLSMEIYPVNYIPSDLRVSQVFAVAFVAIFFSLVSSLYPAWRGANTEPAKVLRYE